MELRCPEGERNLLAAILLKEDEELTAERLEGAERALAAHATHGAAWKTFSVSWPSRGMRDRAACRPCCRRRLTAQGGKTLHRMAQRDPFKRRGASNAAKPCRIDCRPAHETKCPIAASKSIKAVGHKVRRRTRQARSEVEDAFVLYFESLCRRINSANSRSHRLKMFFASFHVDEEGNPFLALDDKYDDIKKLIDTGKEKGYLTYDQVNDLIPQDVHSPEDLDDLLTTIGTQGIDVLEGPKLLLRARQEIRR